MPQPAHTAGAAPIPERCERACRGGHFTCHDSRDLFGFVDGTENPTPDEAPELALLADAPGAGGSFAMTQRWVHHLDTFLALAVPEQESIVGRTKVDDGVPDRLMSFSTPVTGAAWFVPPLDQLTTVTC
jgi:deferrochelatase/peroxidase EfeB